MNRSRSPLGVGDPEEAAHAHAHAHAHDGEETFRQVVRTGWDGNASRDEEDAVAREEPLEIRVGGAALAVVMRTPGHDEELVRGFLATERVADPAAIAGVRHCTAVEAPEAEDNVVLVTLRDGVALDVARLRRNLYASSSCGICGKATIAAALDHAPPLDDACRVRASALYALPDALRTAQDVFARTGGLHAAGLFTLDGVARVVREDVGRHNAVDKVVGWAALRGEAALGGHVLMVSGRVSYEVVQKALAARIPVVAAVSAPSSLAVDLGRAARMTLVGFLRGARMRVYAGGERITR